MARRRFTKITAALVGLTALLPNLPAGAWQTVTVFPDRTFPRDGQQDVPINTKLFLLSPMADVQINGVDAPFVDFGFWDPGHLEPNTDYVVTWIGQTDYVAAEPPTGSFTFRTGSTKFEAESTVVLPPASGEAVCLEESAFIQERTCSTWLPLDCLDACQGGLANIRFSLSDLPDVVVWRAHWQIFSQTEISTMSLTDCFPLTVPYCLDRDQDIWLDGFGPDGQIVASLAVTSPSHPGFPVSDSCEDLTPLTMVPPPGAADEWLDAGEPPPPSEQSMCQCGRVEGSVANRHLALLPLILLAAQWRRARRDPPPAPS